MERRNFVVALASGMLGTAGCTSNSESAEARTLGIEFLNLHDLPHEIEMELVESDKVVLNDRTELPPGEYDHDGLEAATTYDVQNVPTESGEYVLRAWLDGDGPRVFRTGDRPGADCLYLRLFVTREAELVIATTTGCPEETPTET